ncbi:flagellar hook-basal body protein [Legionella genomosp. 1]|uniref:flagellar hook-basal body protein n=1 Tax=Legionella genomosp. 1 TaxID=1093625 RepID=UPI0010551043|nr:flagellar hook basal-body protein [Legionella genomosp. 1]
MLSAIKTTQIALLQDQFRLQVLSQNVSNLHTTGYKRQIMESQDFPALDAPDFETVVQQMASLSNFQQGSISHSNQGSELALAGKGFFEIQNNEGVFYTRSGEFHISQDGELISERGGKLMGKNGPVRVSDKEFSINTKGELFIDKQLSDQIRIVDFPQPASLHYQGEGLYFSKDLPEEASSETRVLQFSLEQSNVKSVDEMTEMLKISRHFEAIQRIMKTSNNLLSTAISQLGEGNV